MLSVFEKMNFSMREKKRILSISSLYRVSTRLHPETNENRHKRTAQHIGSPRRGVRFGEGNEQRK
jgi:hypothetical protein